jgi:aspartyl-tRNA(Asn)/glutamyl-tRNA(Gln) amidotransferase subunit A
LTGQPDLADLGAAGLLVQFASGAATPTDAIEACIARMDSCEPVVAAMRTRCDANAREAAALADARWRADLARPLEGVPFAVKDVIDTAGVLTTLGSTPAFHRVPERNATIVQRLVYAGAILAGKTAVPEFAFGDALDDHRATNPWDRSCWTGGSSAGSAAALAAREVPIALGTDTGGSIRVPASYCGVCGLKPTFGRVPRDGIAPVSWTLDHAGPMARTVEDLARVLTVVAGRSPADPSSCDRPFTRSDSVAAADLRGLRVGIPTTWFLDDCDPDVARVFEEAVGVLTALGAERRNVVIERASLAGIVAWTITVAEFAAVQEGDLDRLDTLTPSSAERIVAGRALGASDYLRALRARHLLQRALGSVFESVDVIVTPATPTLAPRFGPQIDAIFAKGDAAWLERIARNLLIANVTGIPALVLPAGFIEGLPVGLQVLAAPFDEAQCLRVGEAFQSVTDHHRVLPHQA